MAMNTRERVKEGKVGNSAVRMLRSAVLSLIAEDREGAYKPAFVKRMIAPRSDAPSKAFTSPEAFLDDLGSV